MKYKRAIYRDDELYLIKRGEVIHLYGTFDGKIVRESCKTTDLGKAKEYLETRRRQLEGGWREDYESPNLDWMKVATALHRKAKTGAIARGIPFSLRVGDIYSLMKRTKYRCAVSGIPFSRTEVRNGVRDPWAASVDRIENRHGYTLENCRIVCIAANIALSDWGMDVLLRLSRGVLRSSLLLVEDQAHQPLNSDEAPNKPLISLVKNA